MNALKNFKSKFDTIREEEAGDVIQNVLIIAVFVIIVGVVGSILYKAITEQGEATGKCISQIGKSGGEGFGASKSC